MAEPTEEEIKRATELAVAWFGAYFDKMEKLIDKLAEMAGVEVEAVGYDPPDTGKIIADSALKTWKGDER